MSLREALEIKNGPGDEGGFGDARLRVWFFAEKIQQEKCPSAFMLEEKVRKKTNDTERQGTGKTLCNLQPFNFRQFFPRAIKILKTDSI